MIPERGKIYHIEFKDPEFPTDTHYEGHGMWTGETENYAGEKAYLMRINDADTFVETGYFQEKYIMHQINVHEGSTLDSFLLEEASDKIKHLKNLLYECVEYVRAEKALRNTWEGENVRLDKTSDSLMQEIMQQFTPDEERLAHQHLMKKYS